MGKFNKEDGFEGQYFSRNYKKPLRNRLTPEQIGVLELEMKPFYTEKIVTWPKNTPPTKSLVFDERAFFESKGATKNGSVVLVGYVPPKFGNVGQVVEPRDCRPILYEQLSEDLDQLRRSRGKRQYAVTKQSEAYGQQN